MNRYDVLYELQRKLEYGCEFDYAETAEGLDVTFSIEDVTMSFRFSDVTNYKQWETLSDELNETLSAFDAEEYALAKHNEYEASIRSALAMGDNIADRINTLINTVDTIADDLKDGTIG